MNPIFGTYSFIDVHAVLTGPGVNAALGAGSGSAEEGITFEPIDERTKMTIGADGSGMHSLSADRSARVLVRFLKNSPMNAVMQQAMNYQSSTSLFHGKNVFNLANPVTGDTMTAKGVAFAKQPPNGWAKEANIIEWEFLAISTSMTLGSAVS